MNNHKTMFVAVPVIAVLAGACGDETGGESLTVVSLSVDPTGVTFATVPERQNSPGAGEPEYAFLRIGCDGVILQGPTIAESETTPVGQLFFLDSESISEDDDGFDVRVNEGLRFRVSIDDFEQEVVLSRVDLIWDGATLKTEFYLVGFGDGVAHDVRISAYVNGAQRPESTTAPITVETRAGGC